MQLALQPYGLARRLRLHVSAPTASPNSWRGGRRMHMAQDVEWQQLRSSACPQLSWLVCRSAYIAAGIVSALPHRLLWWPGSGLAAASGVDCGGGGGDDAMMDVDEENPSAGMVVDGMIEGLDFPGSRRIWWRERRGR